MGILKNLTEKLAEKQKQMVKRGFKTGLKTPQCQCKLSVISVIAISIITLITIDILPLYAGITGIMQYNKPDQAGGIVKEAGHKTFVICTSCPPVERLLSIKAIFPLAIKVGTNTNIHVSDLNISSNLPAPGVSSVQKTTPQTPPQTPPQTYFRPAIAPDKNNQGKTVVYFDFNSAALKDSEKDKINQTISPNTKVDTVTGYTCDIGTKKYNDMLALKRARTVSSYLKEKGVIPLKVEGKGKCCYVSEEERLKNLNRRAEITMPPDQKILKGDTK